MKTSGISPIRVLRGKWLFLTLGLVGAISSSLQAAVLFSDNFDSYANGTADATYKANYSFATGGTTFVITNGGLSGSKSFQATGDGTMIRTNVPINLAGGSATIDVFFQRGTAGQAGSPQIGLLTNLTGALNTSDSVGGRFNNLEALDVRYTAGGVQNSATAQGPAPTATLITGNWYFLRGIITSNAAAGSFTVVLQLFNSDSTGVVGTGIVTNTQTFTDSQVYAAAAKLYAAVRLSDYYGVTNMDNFSVSQATTLPAVTLTGSLGAVDTTYGTASTSPTSFQISGSSLTGAPGNLTVTPPAGFEVSRTNNSGYSTSLSVPYSTGTLAGTNVFVRLAATTAVGTYSGNITVAGGGDSKTIATVASTVVAAPTVTSFTLMYPGADGPVPGYDPITNNATINLSLIGANLSIRANTSPNNDFGSVVFNLTGATAQFQTDNSYPWSLFGDLGGSYTGAVFNVGAHTLTATPYPADGGSGSAGIASTINFTTTATAPAYPPVGYGLVWSDEFSGSTLDTTKWGYENPGKWRDGYNTPNAVSVTNGLLNITTYTLNGTNFTCELNTYNKFTPKFGYMEASVDFNDSPGMWSAFWMYNYGVPTVGNPKTNGVEVDIIEHLAHNTSDADVSNQGFSTLHWDGYGASHQSVTSGNYNSGFATGFHTCALLWTPDAYQFIMDGVVVWTTTNAPAQDPVPPLSPVSQIGEFLLLSSEVWSNNWAGTTPPGGFGSLATSTTKMKVDYVRYYQVVTVPTIALAETLTAVNTTYGTASPTPSSFRVSGSLLTGDLTVAPPSGYEVSTSLGAGYTTSLTLTPSGGTLPSTLVYVRLKATATVSGSPYSGNITVSGGGAASKTMATAASTVSARPASVTAVAKIKNYGDVNPALTAVTNGAVNGDVINVTLATAATQFSSVGVSNITVTLGSNPNYSVLTTNSTLTISAKAASVTAVAKSKTYGDVNPALTAVTNGAVNGDVINVSLATTATQFSSVGVSNITVTPGSNPNYSVLTTNSTLTINPAGTTMVLASDINPALPGTNVTFTATVSSSAGIPTGSVTFKDGVSTLGTTSLSGSAQGALSTTLLAPGNHTITSEYAGGGNFSGSTNSSALTQVINLPPPPLLSIAPTVGGLQLSWDAPDFNLQQASDCTGLWTNLVPPPSSPFVITPTNSAAFYRLRWNAP